MLVSCSDNVPCSFPALRVSVVNDGRLIRALWLGIPRAQDARKVGRKADACRCCRTDHARSYCGSAEITPDVRWPHAHLPNCHRPTRRRLHPRRSETIMPVAHLVGAMGQGAVSPSDAVQHWDVAGREHGQAVHQMGNCGENRPWRTGPRADNP